MSQSLDEKIAALEAELARLRAERDAQPRRWWVRAYIRDAKGVYDNERLAHEFCERNGLLGCEVVPVIELRPGWRLVRDEPFVATDVHVRTLRSHGDAFPWDAKGLAARLSLIGIPAVAEGAQP